LPFRRFFPLVSTDNPLHDFSVDRAWRLSSLSWCRDSRSPLKVFPLWRDDLSEVIYECLGPFWFWIPPLVPFPQLLPLPLKLAQHKMATRMSNPPIFAVNKPMSALPFLSRRSFYFRFQDVGLPWHPPKDGQTAAPLFSPINSPHPVDILYSTAFLESTDTSARSLVIFTVRTFRTEPSSPQIACRQNAVPPRSAPLRGAFPCLGFPSCATAEMTESPPSPPNFASRFFSSPQSVWSVRAPGRPPRMILASPLFFSPPPRDHFPPSLRERSTKFFES